MRKLAMTTPIAATAFANAPAAAKKADAVAAVTTGVFKLPGELPKKSSKRGTTSAYSFGSLTEVGMSFGVKNKSAKQLSSVVSNQNRKHFVQETDEAGNKLFEMTTLTQPDGTIVQVPDANKPKLKATMHFYVIDVTPELAKTLKGTPLEGSTALIVRDK